MSLADSKQPLWLDGLAADQEDIFPDPNAQAMSQMWWSDPKAFERAFR